MSDISAIVNVINKKYKKDIVASGNDLKESEKIPFTSAKMNYLTRGGIPEGKMVEFAGKESSGKTTSALDILSNYQKKYPDRYSVYFDAENTLDKQWGITLGVDWEKVIIVRPEEEYGELLLDMVLDIIKSGDVGLAIVDSVPFIVPKSAWETGLEDKTYCGNSALMTEFCKKAIPLMNKYNCTIIMINQIRDKVGVPYTAFNLPGGRMLYHAQAQIYFFTKGSLLDENGKEVSNGYENPMGHLIQVKMEKNKVTVNDRRLGFYTLNYQIGVDNFNDLINVALQIGEIRQGGSWFYWIFNGEEITWQGKPKVVDYFQNNEEAFQALSKIIMEKIK